MNFVLKAYQKAATWRPIQNFMRDLSSLRALWCWFFLALFSWATIFIILKNPSAQGTVITVLGGVISIIFTNYVVSTVYERNKKPTETPGS